MHLTLPPELDQRRMVMAALLERVAVRLGACRSEARLDAELGFCLRAWEAVSRAARHLPVSPKYVTEPLLVSSQFAQATALRQVGRAPSDEFLRPLAAVAARAAALLAPLDISTGRDRVGRLMARWSARQGAPLDFDLWLLAEVTAMEPFATRAA